MCQTKSILTLLILIITWPSTTLAEAFTPKDDDQILLRLTASDGGIELAELRRRRAQVTASPDDLSITLDFARFALELGRREGDPRFFGYAQGALQPWWQDRKPPLEVLLLRATLEQHHHQWDKALDDLDRVLRQRPRWAQAWMSRAVVLSVVGKLDAAAASCLPLQRLVSPLLATACQSHVAGLGPRAGEAYSTLSASLEAHPDASTDEQLWALGTLAEIARRQGFGQAAERHFQTALDLDPRDVYLLSAYADWLLDEHRALDVIQLLAGENRRTSLLLRLALAEQQVGSAELANHVETLTQRYASGRRRGQRLHLGEEARLTLHLRSRPLDALDMAEWNWQAQREPVDARILLEAAIAARQPSRAQPVLEHLRDTGLLDIQLQRLVTQLQEVSP